jgi:Protein of unknown function (DUF1573)
MMIMSTNELPLNSKKNYSWMVRTLILINIGLAALAVYAMVSMGSIPAALSYVRGDRLVADERSKSFGTVEQGQPAKVVFRLTNFSKQPIRVIGAWSSCSCLTLEGLPMKVSPGEELSLPVGVRTKKKPGSIQETMSLFTDYPDEGELRLTVYGTILKARNDSEEDLKHASGM